MQKGMMSITLAYETLHRLTTLSSSMIVSQTLEAQPLLEDELFAFQQR